MITKAASLICMSKLPTGHKAEICQIDGRAEHVQRLREIGMRDGVTVEMVRPGTPCIVRLAGSAICFRSADLLRVLVESFD